MFSIVVLASASKALPSNSNKVISGLGIHQACIGKACHPLMGSAGIRIVNDGVSIAPASLVPNLELHRDTDRDFDVLYVSYRGAVILNYVYPQLITLFSLQHTSESREGISRITV